MYIKNMFSRHNKWVLFVIVFIINVIPVFGVNMPVISDEIGTIASAEWVAGNDWTNYIQTMGINYYKYGVLFFYAPIIKYVQDIMWQYRIMLFENALITSFITPIVWDILEKNSLIKNNNHKSLISLNIGLFPGVIIWNKFIWAESLLCIIPWLIIWIVSMDSENRSNNKNGIIKGGVLGILASYGYMVHVRGVVILLAAVLTVIFSKMFTKKWVVNPIAFFTSVFIMIAIDLKLSSYFKDVLWNNSTTNNSTTAVIDIYLDKMLSLEGLISIIKISVGWLFSFSVVGCGLTFLGIVYAISKVVSSIKKDADSQGFSCASVFTLLLFVGSFILGIIFFAPGGAYELFYGEGGRIEKIVYVRYLIYVVTPCLMMGEIYIMKRDTIVRRKAFIYILINAILLKSVLVTCAPYVKNTFIAMGQMAPFPLFIKSVGDTVAIYDEFNERLLFVGLLTLIILFLVLIVRCHISYIYIAMTILFLCVYVFNIKNFVFQLQNNYYDEIVRVHDLLARYDVEENAAIVPMMSRGIYAYQYVFAGEGVVVTYDSDSVENAIVVFDNENKMFEFLMQNEGCYYLCDENYFGIVVKGEELLRRIRRASIDYSRL